jgi:hypothetical protein
VAPERRPSAPADARGALLGSLIDYAGLFPPARLSMEDAVAGYRAARISEHGWMLDRFVCPASRLAELREAVGAGEPRWRVTVVVDGAEVGDAAGMADALGAAVDAAEEPLALDAVELRMAADVAASAEIAAALAALPGMAARAGMPAGASWFVEVPLSADLGFLLDCLAREGLAAKVRCGGASSDAVPPVDALAGFVAGCAARDLTWKATAGLHHPFRHRDPESGQTQHGFLNLLAAAGLAAAGASEEDLVAALADGDPEAFHLDAGGLSWRGSAIGAQARRRFDGYGSCSFDEPVGDLVALGALEGAGARVG